MYDRAVSSLVEIELLGGFALRVDGTTIGTAAFDRRSGADLVQLLALAERRSMHREQVMDALWPDADLKSAANGLHKAASFARKAIGRPEAIVLKGDQVSLLPDTEVRVDVDLVRTARPGDPAAVAAAVDAYRGDVLPESPYTEWVMQARTEVRSSYIEVLTGARRWDDLLAVDPWNESANVAVMQRDLQVGDRQAVLRRYTELERHLESELGLVPSPAAVALRDQAESDPGFEGSASPRGMRAFLLTDIEGSTRRWEADPDATGELLARHDALVRGAIEAGRGAVFKHTGDGLYAVFDAVSDAVAAAVAVQEVVQSGDWGGHPRPSIRVGLDFGEAEQREGDWFGPVLNRTARITSACSGDQILCSGVVAGLAGVSSSGVRIEDVGMFRLPDLAPMALHRVSAPSIADRRTPPRASRVSGRAIGPVRQRMFGREAEAAELLEQIPVAPVVTVVGAGGAGKTHLATDVAGRLHDDFPDGVFLCRFGAVSDAAGARRELLEAMGAQQQADATVVESIGRALERRRVLLVFDNCEHLVDEVGALADQVGERCPDVRILATSRVPLQCRDEIVHRIGELSRAAARELFCAEAAAVGARIDGDDPAIDRICERLDDLPMAVRLAAARTRSLGPEAIESLLADRFEFLAASQPDGIDHHQTLGATIAWSFDALTPELQEMLVDLSTLTGRFSLDAALAVADRGRMSRVALIDGIDALQQRSLIAGAVGKANVDGGGHGYRLLESVRLFARQRSDDDGALLRHLDHFRDRAVQWNASLVDGDEAAHHRFRSSWSDLRQAFATAVAHDRFDDVITIIRACGAYCNSVLEFELMDWSEAGLDPQPARVVSEDHAVALANWSALATHRSEMDLASSLAATAVAAAPTSPEAMYAQAWIPYSVSDLDGSEEWLARIVEAPLTNRVVQCGSMVVHATVLLAKGGDIDPVVRRLDSLTLGRGRPLQCQTLLARGLATIGTDWPATRADLEAAQEMADAFELIPFSATCRTARCFGTSLHAPPEEALLAYVDFLGWAVERGIWSFALASLGAASLLLDGLGHTDQAVPMLVARRAHGFTAGFTALMCVEMLQRVEQERPDEFAEWERIGRSLGKREVSLFGLRAMEQAAAAIAD